MTETYLSPLRYPGGKARAISEIAPFFPAMDSIKEYREPFLGGGSVFLYLKENYGSHYPEIKWWVNELEPYLYNFWVVLRDDVKGVIDGLESYTGKDMNDIRLLKQNSDADNAAIYFIRNKSTFGGMSLHQMDPGNYDRFKNSYSRNKEDIHNRLKDTSRLLKGAKVTNWDYSRLMEEDGSEGPVNPIFTFLDPPYFKAKNLYGKSEKFNLHSVFDHYKFAKDVGKVAGSSNVKLMITYDDAETLRHLYGKIKGVRIIPFEFRYSIAGSEIGHEIMIVNYKSENLITKQTGLFDF